MELLCISKMLICHDLETSCMRFLRCHLFTHVCITQWTKLGQPAQPAFRRLLSYACLPLCCARFFFFPPQEVQTMTAQWNLYINAVGYTMGLLMVPLLGSWSDVAGRRPVLYLSNMGPALQAVVYLLVMYLKLPIPYFLVGRVLCGLSGGSNMVLTACFSYVADISDKRSRTFRVAILESCLGISGMLSGVIGGEWKRARGWVTYTCSSFEFLLSLSYV